ncbi:hypothetical protein EDB80DRAFT_689321 [Ilyonectria destructans]|nr:hypothetical protein EDB80DRAFT_689321 [Ilyonectria destructans]
MVKEAYLRRDDQKKGDPTAGNCTMETGTSDPRNLTPGTSGSSQLRNTGEHEESQTKLQQSTWAIQPGIDGSLKVLNQQTTNDRERSQSNQKCREVSDLSKAQSILDLRRHLGELGKWQGPALEQAFALARAIEKTMAFFMSHSGKTFNNGECLTWTLGVKNAWRHVYGSENGNNDVNNGVIEDIVVTLRYSLKEGWTAPVDELDAALSLWLYSVKDDHLEKDQDASFPSGKDHWIRGVQIPQQKCLHILGPSTDLLLRDLQWWMPNGLDGVLVAELQPTLGPTQESGQNAGSLKQVRVERIGRSGERWPMSSTRQTTSTTNAGDTLSKEGQSGWNQLPSCESGCLTSWICRAAADVRIENGKRRQEQESSEKESSEKESSEKKSPEKESPESYYHLAVESQESLERLYVKDLFSTFVWSLMGYLGQSIIGEKLKANVQPSVATGPEAWKDFSLGSQDLSRLVQNLAELGLWTEREAWLSLIPPLSATDDLPGLEAVIELAQKNAAVAERALAWTQAGETYRWLFDEAAASSPTAHIYVKSTAILMRFQTRMKASPPKKFGTFRDLTYNYRGSGLKEEMAKTEEKLNTQKSQNDSIQLNLNEFFDFHQRLDKNKVSSVRNLEFITFGDSTWRTEQVPYGTLQSVGDIFDRTELHHTMQSNVRDWQTKFSRLGTSEFSDLLKHGSMLHGGRLYQTRAVHDRSVLDELQKRPLGRRAKMEAEMEAKERVETLIRHKADVNAQGLDGSTPLHCAAMSGSLKIARLLVDKGANVAVADFEGRTPLHLTAMNKTTCLSCAQGLQRGMSTPLMTYLLDSGSDIDALDEIGWTPLHFAALSGDTKSIEELMGRGANPNAEDRNGSTPIYLAASCKFGTALDTILDQCTVEGSPYKPDWYLATEKAITCDEVETVRLLMSKMEKKSWPPTKHWKTPFHVAATCKNSEIFIEMIKKAKEREFAPEGILNQTASGDTAFHAAMVARNVEFMQKVIAGVANPPASITNHERELLEQLLKMTDIHGKNVLHWSAGRWFSDSEMTRVIIEAMKAAGLDKTLKSMLEQRDRDGKTPSESVAEWLQGESGLLDQELDRLKEEE